MRAVPAVTLAALMLAIVPSGAAGTSQTVPDLWTGTWPAFLMENGKITDPLGTLRWRQIRHEEGAAMLGKNFGGKVFEGCSASDPSTLFFRGSYVEGGDLVACTTGADGKTIVGRFNGREDFMSGSFEVSIIQDDAKRVFAGKYFEDQGITTDWCGSLERQAQTAPTAPQAADTTAPVVRALASAGKAGRVVQLRLRVSERSAVRVAVWRGSRVVARLGRAVPAGTSSIAWAATVRPGALRFTVIAVDAAGNTSRASAAGLRLS